MFAAKPFVLDPRRAVNEFINRRFVLEKSGLAEGMTLADFGAGAGYFALPAAQMVGSEGKVYAVDILKNSLEAIHSQAQFAALANIEVVWGDLEAEHGSQLPDACADVVLMSHLLSQVKNHGNVLREAARVLKSGGSLVVVEWENAKTPVGPALEKRVEAQKVIAALTKLGLKEAAAFPPGKYHYALIFHKM